MGNDFRNFVSGASDEEIWQTYGLIVRELKKRGLVSTGNITGERGETAAIHFYNSTSRLPNLQKAPIGTKNVDAMSRDGERYAIKTVRVTTTSTGTFQADDFARQRFEYLIIVRLDDSYEPVDIFEAPWEVVTKHKRYDKTMKAYKMPLTKKSLQDCRLVFGKNS